MLFGSSGNNQYETSNIHGKRFVNHLIPVKCAGERAHYLLVLCDDLIGGN